MAWKYMYCEILYIFRYQIVKKKGHNILFVDISMTLPQQITYSKTVIIQVF